MQKEKNKIAIIGNGEMGKFVQKHLVEFFEVFMFDKIDLEDQNLKDRFKDIEIVIFAVNVQNLEEVCIKLKYILKENSVLIDICSVKVLPIKIISKFFDKNKFQILATHPIFGPQSGMGGIENMPIMIENISVEIENFEKILDFIENKLKLKILFMSCSEHDKEMALVQGLTHFIGRALNILNIPDVKAKTKSYQMLIDLKELLKNDSWELFSAIQNGNEYSKKERKAFMKVFKDLDALL